jgi:glycosyl transferase family 87
VQAALERRVVLVAVGAVLTALLVSLSANLVSRAFHDDSLWANALGSLGGTQTPGDFGYVFLPAGDDVLAGRNPYLDPAEFRDPEQSDGPPQAPYAYPPVLAFLVAPLAALPEKVQNVFVPGVLFTLLLIVATVAALRLLEVRDWRCYPVALLYPVTLEAFEYGAIGPLLLLLLALVWRFRDHVFVAAGGVGVSVVLKLFLWPLLVWLVLTSRLRAAVLAVTTAVALALASWAAIAFKGIEDYPRLLRKLVDFEAENSYSVFAVLRTIGVPEGAAQALIVAAAIGLLFVAWRVAHAPGVTQYERDRRSLTLALATALIAVPILWLHYLVLLLVPIALARPRLSALWFAPLALMLFELLDWYRGWPYGDAEALTSVMALLALVFVASLRPRRETTKLAACL